MQKKKALVKNKRVINVRVVLLLSLLVIVASVVVVKVSTDYDWQKKSQAQNDMIREDVSKAYQSSRSTFNQIDQMHMDLSSKEGMLLDKIGETEVSVCYIKTINGGGWATEGYTQVCYDRKTAGYYTNLSHEMFEKMVSDVGFIQSSKSSCVYQQAAASPIARYVPNGSSLSVVSEYGDLDENYCGRPSQIMGSSSVIGKTSGTGLSTRVIKPIDESTIDTSRNQVWMEADIVYYEKDLICKPMISILSGCSLSLQEPIQ